MTSKIFSTLQDPSKYHNGACVIFTADHQFPWSIFQILRDCPQGSSNHCYFHVPKLLLLSGAGGSPRSVVGSVLDCDIVLSEFEIQSCYCFYFQTIALAKGMNLITLPNTELNNTTTVLLQE